MSDSDGWVLLSEQHPPEGVVVETRGKNDREPRELILEKGLFWLTDRSMYVYFVPYEWRAAAAKPELLGTAVAYEVWYEQDGKKVRCPAQTATLRWAQDMSNDYNEDEQGRAEQELRPIRTRYFVVKATTTLEEIS